MIKPKDDGDNGMPKYKKRGKKLHPNSKSKIKYRKQFLDDWVEEDLTEDSPGLSEDDDDLEEE